MIDALTTPLELDIEVSNPDDINKLLTRGARLIDNTRRSMPLVLAAELGYPKINRLLLEAKANYNKAREHLPYVLRSPNEEKNDGKITSHDHSTAPSCITAIDNLLKGLLEAM